MPDILIRHVPKKTLDEAKKIALRHRRSLQDEVSSLLVETIAFRSGTWSQKADWIRGGQAGRKARSDSTELIRRDRRRP